MKGRLILAVAVMATGLLILAPAMVAQRGVIEIKVLSNRADLVSGGDALVEVVLPAGADASALKVQVKNGTASRDVTSAIARRENGKVQGLVTGLPVGESVLIASLNETSPRTAQIALTNHPIGGPVFAGPQVQPWICMTVEAGLGDPLDAQCNAAAPKVDFLYRSNKADAGTAFLPYDVANPPADVAQTTTDHGKTVPYIVRREQGTLDRAIYTFAVLFDPSKTVSPWQSPTGWNHKLYYSFGGGASPAHRQGAAVNVTGSALQLGRGFVVASSSLNTFGNNTNSVVSAEVVMMVKELITEKFGEIRYTIATGGSGGAMQQNLIANAYPGLLDGIQPSQNFPDLYKNQREAQECALVVRYFRAAPEMWPDAAVRTAVTDNENLARPTCEAWVNEPRTWGDPTIGCVPGGGRGAAAAAPPEWIYDAVKNPKGTRCTIQDYQVAMFGRRPDGFANRPFDNVGIQYGLVALEKGLITPEQFVDMNEKVGGVDIDQKWTPERSQADLPALTVAYRTGQLNMGTFMNTAAVIDNRTCRNTDGHSCYHTWVTRERMLATHGSANSALIFFSSPANTPFETLDKWVAAFKDDTSNAPLAEKVLRNRPADATDACWIEGQKVTDMKKCVEVNLAFGNPHTGAGAPMKDDILKCQLKPLNRASYKATFTDAQWNRLKTALSGGVCDWSKPSVGYTAALSWLTFEGGPGGKPLGAAPKSK